MSSRAKRVGVAAIVLAAVAVGYGVGTVFAEGVPSTGALTYAGVLENDAGEPLSGTHEITVDVYDAQVEGNLLCTATDTQNLIGGRFEIGLPDTCADAVHGNPNLWVEIVADDTSLGRTKIGAVPYALEAGHAVEASEAVGTLAEQITSRLSTMDADLNTVNPATTMNLYNIEVFWQGGTSVTTVAADHTASITFPEPFPTGLVVAIPILGDGSTISSRTDIMGSDADGITVITDLNEGQMVRINWLALGW